MTTNRELFAKYVHLGTFIETGSAYGRSIGIADELGYRDIRSVEGATDRFLHCREQFKQQPHIRLWHGESIKHLPAMVENMRVPALFLLDAHPSGAGSYGQDYATNRTHAQSHILRAELQIIRARNCGEDVILIDDLTPDISEFARQLFPEATITVHDTDEGPAKVMEIVLPEKSA